MEMKKYKIEVMYPGKYPDKMKITAELYVKNNGCYEFHLESGKKIYLPIDLTVVEELN